MYESVALFFADRFGIENLTKSVLQQLYTWSYSLRLSMYAVYSQTINKYANGLHERVNEGLAMFSVISQMSDPEELKLIILEQPEMHLTEKFDLLRKEIYHQDLFSRQLRSLIGRMDEEGSMYASIAEAYYNSLKTYKGRTFLLVGSSRH